MDKLYVISGVTGMTGNELARQIIKTSEDLIIGFDNFFASSMDTISDLKEEKRFRFFPYDLTNKEEMSQIKELVLKSRAEKIIYINCAAVVHTEHFYHIEETFETNVLGMKDFLQQAIEVNAEIFINCSTSEVYSMQSYKPGGVKEEDFLVLATAEHSQRTSYAAGKLLTEFMLKEAVLKKQISGCSIRFANVYSRNEKLAKHIIPYAVTSLKETKAVTLLENAKQTSRTFLHNTDSCRAVLCLASCDKALDGSVYNVATEEEKAVPELVQMIADKLGIKDPEIRYEGRRESDPERRLLNSEKIRRITGWKPEVSLEEGLEQCIQAMKEKQTS